MSSEELTLVLRGVAVGLALVLWLAALALQRRARLALVPVLACVAAYLLRSAPQSTGLPLAVLVPLSIAATLFPLAFWWLVRDCAKPSPRLDTLNVAVIALALSVTLTVLLGFRPARSMHCSGRRLLPRPSRRVQRLSDPACDRRPILTLALEAGFGSIGPFNRAFRERHGVSPSEFRAMRRTATPA